jgi:hypothetical protein
MPNNKGMIGNYIGKVIHFVGGINQYVGRLDAIEVLLYGDMFIITNPCLCFISDKGIGLSKLGGELDVFEPHVMIYQPADKPFEIREVTPGNDLAKAYFKEASRKKSEIIAAPGSVDVASLKLVR